MSAKIILNNNKSRIITDRVTLEELREDPILKVRSPGAFYSPAFRKRQWDGYIRYVWENGNFSTGLIDLVVDTLKKLKIDYTIEDSLEHIPVKKVKSKLGESTLRDYQHSAVEAIINNKFEGVDFQRGILHEATNAGKSYIAMGLYYNFKVPGLILINNTLIHEQLYQDLLKQFPDDVGIVSSKKIIWKRFNVCMVTTLANLISKDPKIRGLIGLTKLILVDECDAVITMKATKKIVSYCFNAPIRVGLSGTVFGKSMKEKVKNRSIQEFFGPIIHRTTNKDLVDKGVSTQPDIRIVSGNTKIILKGDYPNEYERGIIKSRERNKKAWKVAINAMNRDRLPMIILFKNHRHIKYLQKYIPDEISHLKIEYAWHKTPNRDDILRRFKQGRVDILVCSMIIKRGMNLPLIATLLNAAGGDSWRNVLQILGRSLRKHESKDVVYVYDFYDKGAYLQLHSKHRLKAYKDEGFEVKELFKKTIKK